MQQLSRSYFHWLFPAFLLALVFSKALASVLEVTLLVFSLAFAWRQISSLSVKKYLPAISLGAVFIFYLLGILWSDDKTAGFKFSNIQHSLLVIPLILFLNRRKAIQKLDHYLLYFIYGAAVAGIFTLLLNAPGPQFLEDLTHRYTFLEPFEASEGGFLNFGLYNPLHPKIQFSNLLGMAALACFYLLFQNPKRWALHGALLAIIISSLALGGRGGQLALLFGLYVFVAAGIWQEYLPKLGAKFGRPVAIALFLVGMGIFTLATPIIVYKTVPPVTQRYDQLFWELEELQNGNYVNHEYEHFTSLRRIVSWQNSWTLIQQHFWLGTGTGDYKAGMQQVYANSNFSELPVNNHSQYLHLWACLGLLGLGLFMWCVVWWVFTVLRQSDHFWLNVFALAFMGFYLISMIPDAILLRQSDNMLFALFFSWLGVAAIHQNETAA